MFSIVQTCRGLIVAAAAAGLAFGASACAGRTAETTGGTMTATGTSAGRDSATASPAGAGAARVERGRYLVVVAACSDCHTPMKAGANGPEPDLSRYLGGHPQDAKLPPPPAAAGPWVWHGAATNTAYAGPWGVTYAANLTPHTHGMAAWTEDMFVRAMRTGKHMGESRPIQPPMPWQHYGQMSDEDLKAIFTYLKSVAPVNNVVPDYQPPGARR